MALRARCAVPPAAVVQAMVVAIGVFLGTQMALIRPLYGWMARGAGALLALGGLGTGLLGLALGGAALLNGRRAEQPVRHTAAA